MIKDVISTLRVLAEIDAVKANMCGKIRGLCRLPAAAAVRGVCACVSQLFSLTYLPSHLYSKYTSHDKIVPPLPTTTLMTIAFFS